MTIAEIRKLTPFQARRIYFHPRDRKTGQVEMPFSVDMEQSRTLKTIQAFVAFHRKNGKTDDEINALWEAHIDRLAQAPE